MGKYWYLWAVLIILVPVTAYVCYKAAQATRQAREEREKTIEQLNAAKSLKDEFSGISRENLEKADSLRAISGIALLVDLKLRKEIRPGQAFEKLSEEWKNAYVLNCILEDCDGKVSTFFRKNTPPVSTLAEKALKTVGLSELSELFSSVYPMFDDDNEDVSVDSEKIKAADEKFGSLFDRDKFIEAAAGYIKNNSYAFTGEKSL